MTKRIYKITGEASRQAIKREADEFDPFKLCDECKHVSISLDRDYSCSLKNGLSVNHDETCEMWEQK